jgi:hypothetical protein
MPQFIFQAPLYYKTDKRFRDIFPDRGRFFHADLKCWILPSTQGEIKRLPCLRTLTLFS